MKVTARGWTAETVGDDYVRLTKVDGGKEVELPADAYYALAEIQLMKAEKRIRAALEEKKKNADNDKA